MLANQVTNAQHRQHAACVCGMGCTKSEKKKKRNEKRSDALSLTQEYFPAIPRDSRTTINEICWPVIITTALSQGSWDFTLELPLIGALEW